MRRYKVRILSVVNEDIDELMSFYEEIAGEEAALRFQGAINETISSLEYLPKLHPAYGDDKTVRRVNMRNHKVSIVYVVDDGNLDVIAVRAFHQLRSPAELTQTISERLRS